MRFALRARLWIYPGRLLIVYSTVIVLFTGCFALPKKDQKPGKKVPKLVALIVVDQFPTDYVKRFYPFLSDGLKRLIDEGALFNGVHDHSITETCPGHATIATGRFPSNHGIVSNHWFDQIKGSYRYCLGEKDGKGTPENLLVPNISDQLRRFKADSKIISVSGKDRAAVILGGKKPDISAWFSHDKLVFETGDYYEKRGIDPVKLIAPYGKDFLLRSFQSSQWSYSPIPKDKLEAAEIFSENTAQSVLGKYLFEQEALLKKISTTSYFRNDANFSSRFLVSPFLDEATSIVALELAKKLQLGQKSKEHRTDLLTISFSAIDLIGHKFGPNSREILEALISLDKTIGRVLSQLQALVNREDLLVVLTSDHGIQPLPESFQRKGIFGRRITKKDLDCTKSVTESLSGLANGKWLTPVSFWLKETSELNKHQKKGLLQKHEKRIKQDLLSCGWIESIIIPSLNHGDQSTTPFERELHRLFKNSYVPSRSPDIHIIPRKGITPELGTDAVHGAPYEYDMNVPIILWGGDVNKSYSTDSVQTAAIAPFIAKLVSLPSLKTDASRSSIDSLLGAIVRK